MKKPLIVLSLCIGIKIGALLTPGPIRRNPTT